MHGLVTWFDVSFAAPGAAPSVTLSTSPYMTYAPARRTHTGACTVVD